MGDAGRAEFFALEGGYHGDTLGAMSLGKGSGFFSLYEELIVPGSCHSLCAYLGGR